VILGNLYEGIPNQLPEELLETLIENLGLRIERILSMGHATPPGTWCDQDQPEWVVLLRGQAGLRFDGEDTRILNPGDYVLIPAHSRHRVEWTSTHPAAVWLAVHFREA